MNVTGPLDARDPLAAQSPSAAGIANAKIEQAWLRELERAQGEQRNAPTRPGAAAPAAGKNAPAPVAREPQRAATPTQNTESWVASRAPRAGAGGAAAATPRGAAAAEEPFAAGKPGGPAVAARDADAAPALDPARAFELQIAARLWGAPRRWDPRRVHARERGGRVWIWIRDAEFDDAQTGAVASALSTLAREAGLELEGITVNGKVVFGRLPDDRENTT